MYGSEQIIGGVVTPIILLTRVGNDNITLQHEGYPWTSVG